MPDLIATTDRTKATGANAPAVRAEAKGVLVTVHHMRRILEEHN